MSQPAYDEPTHLKVPPCNIDAELAVIGSVLLHGVFARAASILKPEDFYRTQHQQIWAACEALDQVGREIDGLTVAEQALRMGVMEGQAIMALKDCLAASADMAGAASNVEAWARVVKDLSRERQLIGAFNRAADTMWGEGEAQSKIDRAQAIVMQAMVSDTRVGAKPVGDTLDTFLADFNERAERKGLRGLSTGFAALDERTSGLVPGDLIVIAGRPSMGKTTLAMNMATSAASKNHRVMVFSLEMPEAQITGKIVSELADLPMWAVMDPHKLGVDKRAALPEALEFIRGLPILIEDSGAISVMDIRQRARVAHAEQPLSMIVVDYLQLMEGEGNSANERIGNITRQLKLLAKELRLPVVLLSQLNRSLETRTNKRPTKADLRDSGAIEQDADIIWFVYREVVYNEDTPRKHVAEIITDKFRMGQIGTDYLKTEFHFSRFVDLKEDLPPVDSYGETWDGGFDG